MQVSPSVRAVMVPDDNPMHPDFTCIYTVGDGQVLTIDSGEAIDRYHWFIKGYLAATEKAEIALAGITHHHADHSGNLKWMQSELKAEIIAPKHGLPLLKGRLPRSGVRTFADGEVIELDGGVRVRVIFTPGHSTDSVVYYLEDEGVLFSGDTLLGSSTTTVHDLGDYRRSLQMLAELPNLKVICPGHGKLIWDPRERIQMYINHRNMREKQITDILGQGGALSSWDIMLQMYPDLDKRLRRAAENNVRAHLTQLEDEERVKVHAGKPRRPSVAKQRRQEEHARERQKVIKLAKKYETEQRRAELRAQENPASSEWIEPPRYEAN
ncbi:MAG: MBL fold metallo-hydrolase [Dehalococcoidia bacterium]|nr:MBL fold metallo-hydrolase [Dehalococcoidia bacterium]MCB9486540.1 MBL fold metallo-hydrolase [Thermoflexaceae bacterium]